MHKIAVIGANSFLAKKLLKRLSGELYTCSLFGKNKQAGFDTYPFVEFNYPEKAIDFSILLESDSIFYFAAAGVQASLQTSAELIYGVNTFLPITIANYLTEQQYGGQLITFGSYFEIGSQAKFVYFNEQELAQTELPVPNAYCASKRLLTRQFTNNMHSFNWYHLILPTIYGPGEDSNRLIPYLIAKLINNEPLKITKGLQTRQYVHADDILDLLENFIIPQKVEKGIYNLSGNSCSTVRELTNMVYSVLEKSFEKTEIISRSDENMLVLLLNNKKIFQSTGWMPKISIEAGIKSYL